MVFGSRVSLILVFLQSHDSTVVERCFKPVDMGSHFEVLLYKLSCVLWSFTKHTLTDLFLYISPKRSSLLTSQLSLVQLLVPALPWLLMCAISLFPLLSYHAMLSVTEPVESKLNISKGKEMHL